MEDKGLEENCRRAIWLTVLALQLEGRYPRKVIYAAVLAVAAVLWGSINDEEEE